MKIMFALKMLKHNKKKQLKLRRENGLKYK